MRYETNLEEVNKALKLADKKIIIESKDRIVIVCELTKKKRKTL